MNTLEDKDKKKISSSVKNTFRKRFVKQTGVTLEGAFVNDDVAKHQTTIKYKVCNRP